MGGMFGGGGDAPEQAPVQEAQPPDPLNLKTTGYGGMGPTVTPQTFTAQGKPKWMTGWFDMPSWGRSAANPNQALTQQMLQPQVPRGGGGGGGQGDQGMGAKDLRDMMMMMSGGIHGGPGVGPDGRWHNQGIYNYGSGNAKGSTFAPGGGYSMGRLAEMLTAMR